MDVSTLICILISVAVVLVVIIVLIVYNIFAKTKHLIYHEKTDFNNRLHHF